MAVAPAENVQSSVIHFVDVTKIETELRPVCGAWSELVTWTTVPGVTTCPACMASLGKRARRGVDQRRGLTSRRAR
jgi:hypothetical protein